MEDLEYDQEGLDEVELYRLPPQPELWDYHSGMRYIYGTLVLRKKALKPLWRADSLESIIYPRQIRSVRKVTEAILGLPKTEDPDKVRIQSTG